MAVAWLIWPLVLSLRALSVNSVIYQSESLLKFKQSLTNAKSLDSWSEDSKPCGKQPWVGLLCNQDFVFGIQIEQMDLSGNIDVSPLSNLPSLRTISIINNSFSGKIPEFNQLTALRSLYLSGNRFSGSIPSDYFEKLVYLKKVWLSDNNFSGLLPLSLATALPNLKELHAENNQFIGVIPNFTQTTLVSIDLSNNRLTGEIPPGLSRFDPGVFAGNPDLCGGKLGTTCTHTQPKDAKASITIEGTMKDANTSKYYLAFCTLGLLLIVIVISLVFCKKKKKKRRKRTLRTSEQDNNDDHHIQVTVDGSSSSSKQSKKSRSGELTNKSMGVTGTGDLVMVNMEKGVFGLPDLMKAAAHVLGNPGGGSSRPRSSGGVGSAAYKAVIANGVTVVVKRLTVINEVSVDVFDKEIRKLGSLRHRNILAPLAYHFRRDEKLLVFEFVPNLSLLHRLHGDNGDGFQLDWPSRHKIIQGIARGMWYLHRELEFLSLPHGNLKSSNIFIGDEGEPLVSEFGLQRLIDPDAKSQSLVAYRSPEANRDGSVSPKSDVFSFGVVIMEILTGKFPSQYAGLNRAGGTDLVEWIGSAMEQGGWMDLLHPTVAAAADNKDSSDEIENVLRIGVRCTAEDPDRRPNMTELMDELTVEDSSDDFITIET